MSDAEDRRFELTTSLSVPLMSPSFLGHYVEALEEAVRKAVADIPTVTAYFVAPDPEAVEVVIGLRFEGMEPRYIEDTATEIIETSIEMLGNGEEQAPRPVREESSLVPA
jgi:hypothetical protein